MEWDPWTTTRCRPWRASELRRAASRVPRFRDHSRVARRRGRRCTSRRPRPRPAPSAHGSGTWIDGAVYLGARRRLRSGRKSPTPSGCCGKCACGCTRERRPFGGPLLPSGDGPSVVCRSLRKERGSREQVTQRLPLREGGRTLVGCFRLGVDGSEGGGPVRPLLTRTALRRAMQAIASANVNGSISTSGPGGWSSLRPRLGVNARAQRGSFPTSQTAHCVGHLRCFLRCAGT